MYNLYSFNLNKKNRICRLIIFSHDFENSLIFKHKNYDSYLIWRILRKFNNIVKKIYFCYLHLYSFCFIIILIKEYNLIQFHNFPYYGFYLFNFDVIAICISFVINIELLILAIYYKLSWTFLYCYLFIICFNVYIPTGLFKDIAFAVNMS